MDTIKLKQNRPAKLATILAELARVLEHLPAQRAPFIQKALEMIIPFLTICARAMRV